MTARASSRLAQQLTDGGYAGGDAVAVARAIPTLDDTPPSARAVELADAVRELAAAGLDAHRVGLLLRGDEVLAARELIRRGMPAGTLDTISQGEWLTSTIAALDAGAGLDDTIRVCLSPGITSLDLIAFTEAEIPADALTALLPLDDVDRFDILRIVRTDGWDTVTALVTTATHDPAGALRDYGTLLTTFGPELSAIPVDVRVLAAVLAAGTPSGAISLLPAAAATIGQSWAGTAVTLLRDGLADEPSADAAGDIVVDALLTARGLEHDLPPGDIAEVHAQASEATLHTVNAAKTWMKEAHAGAYAAAAAGHPWSTPALPDGAPGDGRIAFAAAVLTAREHHGAQRTVTLSPAPAAGGPARQQFPT